MSAFSFIFFHCLPWVAEALWCREAQTLAVVTRQAGLALRGVGAMSEVVEGAGWTGVLVVALCLLGAVVALRTGIR